MAVGRETVYWKGNRSKRSTRFLIPASIAHPPCRLSASAKRSHTGTKVYGDGFVLTAEEGVVLLREHRYRNVVKPYLIGKELNDDPYCRPSKYIVDFTDMGEQQARAYPLAWAIVEQRVKETRQSAPEQRG